MSSFAQLPLLPSLLATISEQGFTRLTEIQDRAMPALLDGGSFVGVAETGSGKTLAFVLPLLHQLKVLENNGDPITKKARPRGLVLVPGRELGEQVSKVFKTFTHTTRLRVRTALGGTRKQIARQNVSGGVEILVATPGRLGQLLDAGDLRLDDVRMLVFDEADQILDQGFLPTAKRLIKECPDGVQLVMFSATLPESLQASVDALFTIPPMLVRTRGSHKLVPTLTTVNLDVVHGDRASLLHDTIAEAPSMSTILFSNTREQCEKVAQWLEDEGTPYVDYRGQMDRRERRDNLALFRAGKVAVMLTTDLGGRGLDIDRVERVINVHLPRELDNYLHRVGRTARAGRRGMVINLVTARDQPLMESLKTLQKDD